MMRFVVTIGGILLLVSGLAAAQENNPNPGRLRRPFHPRPQAHGQPINPVVPRETGAYAYAPPAMPSTAPLAPAPVSTLAPNPVVAVPTPENLPPPTPAQVTYRNGLLTVQATNSTLSGLLTAIRNKTGIQFEGLEGGGSERVVVAMGPATEGEVLATILGGSQFDYVVVDRPDSPGIVQWVILTPRAGVSPATAAGMPRPRIPTRAQLEGEEEVPDETSDPDQLQVQPQDTPVRPPLTQAQPLPQTNQQQTTPKTPQQFLEELKQMKERQQQLQRQQPQGHDEPPL